MSVSIVAGVGCRRDCSSEDILAVVRSACEQAGQTVHALAAPAFKADHAGLQEAARRLALPLILIEAAALAQAQENCATRSAVALRTLGVASVAEASALAAAGLGSRLILPRIANARATCALAEAAA